MHKERLKQIIEEKSLCRYPDHLIVSTKGSVSNWLMDLRATMLDGEALDIFTEIFWDKMKGYFPFQIGGLEVSSIPMIAAVLQKGFQKGYKANGFIIRKERKTTGLCRRIEGNIQKDIPIVLIDDLSNGGASISTMCEVLQNEGYTAEYFFTLVDFFNKNGHKRIEKLGLQHINLFHLFEFGLKLGREPQSYYWNYKPFSHTSSVRFDFPDFFHTKAVKSLIPYNKEVLFLTENASLILLDAKKQSSEILFNTFIVLPEAEKSNLLRSENTAFWVIHGTELIAFDLLQKILLWRYTFEKMEQEIIDRGKYILLCHSQGTTYFLTSISKSSGKKIFEWEFSKKPSIFCSENHIFILEKSQLQIVEIDSFRCIENISIPIKNGQLLTTLDTKLFCISDHQRLFSFDWNTNTLDLLRKAPLIDQGYISEKYIIITTIKNRILIYDHNNTLLKNDVLGVRINTPFQHYKDYLYFASSYNVFLLHTKTLEITLIKITSERILDLLIDQDTLYVHLQGNQILTDTMKNS